MLSNKTLIVSGFNHFGFSDTWTIRIQSKLNKRLTVTAFSHVGSLNSYM